MLLARNFAFNCNVILSVPHVLSEIACHTLCIVIGIGMPFPHDHMQYEKLQKLESELEDLTNERDELEKDWISNFNLSPEEEKHKLEELRNTPQKNRFRQLIHVAHKNVMAKKHEVEKLNQQLNSAKRDPELAKLIACKEKEEKQVMPPV